MISSTSKKILIIYYSFSGQTNSLLRGLEKSLTAKGHEVVREKLIPVEPLRFPLDGYSASIKMMLTTFFRRRMPILNISSQCEQEFDLIILAGPTWSYNPSGPILALLDRDGTKLFRGKSVIPLISCRGYWRLHWFGLRKKLKKCGAYVPNLMVFSHPNREPWRTIGVFLKISGKTPERSPLLKKYYKKYGHAKEQQKEAHRFGELISDALSTNTPLDSLDFRTPQALP
jgi:multimeric flavodoxin WrbA